MKPTAWQPDPPEIEHLRMLGRRRYALISTREVNRLGVADAYVNDSIQKVVTFLEQEIERITKCIKQQSRPEKKRDLLRTIPDVGDVTIEAILSEANGFDGFDAVEKVVAYIGLSPEKEKTSGTSRAEQ